MPNPDGTLTTDEALALATAAIPKPLAPPPPEWAIPREALVAASSPASHAATKIMAAQNAASAGRDPQQAAMSVPPPMDLAAGIVNRAAAAEKPAQPVAGAVPGAEKWGTAPPPAPPAGPSFPPVPGVGGLGMFGNTTANVREQQRAITGLGEAEAAKARVASETLAAQAEDRTRQENYRQEALAGVSAESDKLREDILNSKIDPNRLWRDQGAGQHAASLVGIILGGIGAGMSRGPNMALETINRMIDRDVNAQTAELGKKQNALSFLMQKYSNLEHAQQALRISQGEVYKMNLDSQLSKMDEGVQKQRGLVLSAQAGSALAQMKDQFAQQIGMLQYQMSFMTGGAGGGTQAYGHGSSKNATPPSKIGIDGILEARAQDRLKTYYLMDGTPMLAVDQARAKEAADQMGGLKAAGDLLARLAAGQYGPVETSRATDAARAEIARVLGKGQITGETQEIANNIVGGFKSRWAPGVDPYSVARDVLHDRMVAATVTASGVTIPRIREKGR